MHTYLHYQHQPVEEHACSYQLVDGCVYGVVIPEHELRSTKHNLGDTKSDYNLYWDNNLLSQ